MVSSFEFCIYFEDIFYIKFSVHRAFMQYTCLCYRYSTCHEMTWWFVQTYDSVRCASSGRPGGELFFLFWPDWFPWLSKAGNDFIAFCIFSAEWYTKTGWCCFLFVGSLNHIFLVLVYLTWLLIWLADWFIKSNWYFYARGACFHTRDSQV